jgi:hypothetical protein
VQISDGECGPVRRVGGTVANVNDVVEANSQLHWKASDGVAAAGFQDAHRRPDAQPGVNWHTAFEHASARRWTRRGIRVN